MTVTPQNRAIFEGAGFDAIKLEYYFGGIRFNLGVKEIRDQAQEWLAETEAKLKADKEAALALERRRYWWMLTWTVIAAVAACIAAWPIIKSWFGGV